MDDITHLNLHQTVNPCLAITTLILREVRLMSLEFSLRAKFMGYSGSRFVSLVSPLCRT